MKKILGYFIVAFLGGIASISVSNLYEKPQGAISQISNYQPGKLVSMPSASPEAVIDFTSAANTSIHSVVHVTTTMQPETQGNTFFYDPFNDMIWGNQPKQHMPPQQASGSGVIISNDGYIVTNNHVISKADNIEVTLNDKRTYPAKVIGRDPSTDLALLKIDEKDLPYLAYGNSDDVKIGEWVLAVGNPFNLNSTVTAGIVSAKARNINIIQGANGGAPAVESFIQTDAAVNPGNSGGALVATNGQLIGINSAIASNTGSYTGYSFAIPVNIVRKVVADLLEFGEVQRGFIGISIKDIDAKFAKEKNINVSKGVYVDGLTEGGSASAAGIEAGDIITKIGEVEVNNVPQLQEQVSRFRPGDKIMVSLTRGDQEKIVPVVLKNKNGNLEVMKKNESIKLEALGATFEKITPDDMSKLNIKNGLRITGMTGGKLRSAGIREGFIITSIDKKKINELNDLQAALENKQGGVLIEGVYPNGTKAYYGFGL